jgi:hypothetical protein
VIERLNTSVARTVQTPAFRKLEVEGLTLAVGPPADLDRYVRAEAARCKPDQHSNIKPGDPYELDRQELQHLELSIEGAVAACV